MSNLEILKKSRGAVLVYILGFVALFLILIAALFEFVSFQLRISQKKIAWHEALNIAEAGIEYYKWCLNNGVSGCEGERDFVDSSGNVVGKFKIEAFKNAQCGITFSTKIVSTGWTTKFPEIKRKVSAFFDRESVAKYAFILNSNVWVGSDHVINGPFHSNGGIRFDGTNLSSVSSAQKNWVCTNSFGCGPSGVGYGWGLCPPECQTISNQCVCPGVFSTTQNSNRDLFFYPVPQFDFSAISADFAQIKNLTKNQGLGLYFGPSGAKGYRVVINQREIKVWKVLKVNLIDGVCTIVQDKVICDNDPCQPECPKCISNTCVVKDPVISQEALIFQGQIPEDCGVIFFEDDLWVGREDQPLLIKGKITIAAANLEDPSKKVNAWLQGNINYTTSDGSDGLLILAQNNNLIGLYSPNYLTLRGIFVAQKGFFGRNYYPPNLPYSKRENLTIFGSIVSEGRVGTKWVRTGGGFISGYQNRQTYIDPNLLYNPPLFTPFLSSQFKVVNWQEE